MNLYLKEKHIYEENYNIINHINNIIKLRK